MADITSVDLARRAGENLEQASPDLLRAMVQTFAQALMGAEADALCGAPYGQVSEERVNYRNGYRERRWDTRAGTMDLAIPKLRAGSYFPEWLLERRRRAEQALISVVATSCLLGVSTRRVEKLAGTLGITSLSKSQVSELAKSLDGAVEEFRSRPRQLVDLPARRAGTQFGPQRRQRGQQLALSVQALGRHRADLRREPHVLRSRDHDVGDHPGFQAAHPVRQHRLRHPAQDLETLGQQRQRRRGLLVGGEPHEPEPRPSQHRAEHVQGALRAPVDHHRVARRPHRRGAAPVMTGPPRRFHLRDQAAEVPR